MRAWIFQAAGGRYDLEGAVGALDRLTWTIRQHETEIHAGDRAYLWQAGMDGGLLAVGVVESDPADMPLSEPESDFAPAETGVEKRVWVRVESVLPRAVSRDRLEGDAVLKHLTLLRQRQGTNFPVSESQAERLDNLIQEVSAERGHFILVISSAYPETWARCKELGQWGATQLDRISKAVRPGDRFLVWLGRRGFSAVGEFDSAVFEVIPDPSNEWGHGDQTYPFRFEITPKHEYAQVYKPEFPGGRNGRLGLSTAQFQRSLVRISKDKYELIKAELEHLESGAPALAPQQIWTDADDPSAPAWLILQAPGSVYRDVEGVAYHYPLRIPNARRIAIGDTIVVARPAKSVIGDQRVLSVARVGRVDRDEAEATAYYDRYLHLDPPLSFEELGGDPRNNQTNSINRLTRAFVERVLKAAGHTSMDALPVVLVPAEGRRSAPDLSPPSPLPSVGISPRTPQAEPPLTFEELLDISLMDEEALRPLVEAIRDSSPQVALAGPPGTSKTWLAQLIARHLAEGRVGAVTLVQFHPSYAYEQFIEGLRPVVKAGGGIDFGLVPGIVPSIAKNMEAQTGLHFLVIDEMNRANLPRVFGELMYLFEYRDKSINLQYSKNFRLPSDLRFIGTMNTADRSIRSIDVALRRRFDVFEFPPDPVLLGRFYDRGHGTNTVDGLIEGFVQLNAALTDALDRHHTIGHAFFMAKLMDRERLSFVWKHKIAPLVEEYFFDQPDMASSFELETFWPA